MPKKGKIYSYTVIYSAAEAFKNKTPYALAIVEEDGSRFVSMIEGCDNNRTISIGMDVEFSHDDASGSPVYKII